MSLRVSRSLVAMLLILLTGCAVQAQESKTANEARGTERSAGSAPGGAEASKKDARGAESSSEPAPAGAEASAAKPSDRSETPSEPEKPKRGELERATFGGGCFWCMEAVFQRVPGVRQVVSGYSGGGVAFPSYAQVCSGMTGHAEVIDVVFEPAVVSYEKLLEVFWRSHDPTTPNAQGPDVGTQYRSIILYHNEKQRKAIVKVHKELKARRVLRGNVVTQAVPFQVFFPAEAYHQNYYNNHPADPYSLIYIEPKFDVFRKMLKTARPKSRTKAAATAPKGGAVASEQPAPPDEPKP